MKWVSDDYVGTTGHERTMLFGSGKIPMVKSYCQALPPERRGPVKSHKSRIQMLGVSEKDLDRFDAFLKAHPGLSLKTSSKSVTFSDRADSTEDSEHAVHGHGHGHGHGRGYGQSEGHLHTHTHTQAHTIHEHSASVSSIQPKKKTLVEELMGK